MSDPTIDHNRVIRNGSNKEIGKADYGGQVRDGWRDKGKIENGRYIDENGIDQGWVNKSSSGGSSSGLDSIAVILIFGSFYLMYKGIKWLFIEGKKSMAHASRSWGITSIFFPPVFFLALTKGYSAIKEIEANREPSDHKGIAQAGIVFGYIGGVLCIMAIVGVIVGSTGGY